MRRWFPDGKPIGRRVRMSGVREIVGVVADVQQGDPTTAGRAAALRAVCAASGARGLVRRAGRPEPGDRALALRRRSARPSAASTPTLPSRRSPRSIELQSGAIARPRFYTALLALFAVAALAAGRHRHLRRHELHRRRAHPGDRHPPRARRPRRRRPPHDRRRALAPRADRRRARPRRRLGAERASSSISCLASPPSIR